MASFFVTRGNDQGRRFDLQESVVSIGREPDNPIQLCDAEVSRRHALVVFQDDGYHLIDLESANGVFVNGRRIQDHPLKNGDQILVGQTFLLFAKAARNDDIPSSIVSPPPAHTVEMPPLDATEEPYPILSEILVQDPQADAHLKMMYHTTLVTSQTLDIDLLLHRILDLIFEWMEIERGSILLYNPETTQLVPAAVKQTESTEPSRRFRVNQSVVSYVLKRREGILTVDDLVQKRPGEEENESRDVICAPMLGRYGLVGLIYIDARSKDENGEPRGRLTLDHLQLMIAVAHQAALAVEDTRYYKGMIQAERLATVGQTVSIFSHHIKNILQGISGGSHLIQMGLNGHDEGLIQQGWNMVAKNQGRISGLILDMLTFSKEREPSYEFQSFVETVSDVFELMSGRARESDVELTLHIDEDIPLFYFDPEQLHRAITNIVTNGIDAAKSREDGGNFEKEDVDTGVDTVFSRRILVDDTASKGRVEIRVGLADTPGYVRVCVDDNGPGISLKLRRSLFKPFYSRKKSRGTGLGLSVTSKIVREHGGTIRVGDAPLGGARFEMEFPIKLDAPLRDEFDTGP